MGEQLNALDATFLELEEADQGAHMHIGGVMIFEPPPGQRAPAAPAVEQVRADLAGRLDRLPRYRQRLSAPKTGGISWPSWEDDPRFDLSGHIRRASLPAPGGEAELLEWAGEYFSERLDRSRPLWELVVLEGLSGGRWALVSKTHHCMVDGVGAVDVSHVLLDVEPGGSPSGDFTSEPPLEPPGLPAASSTARTAAGGAVALAKLPLRLGRAGAGVVGSSLGMARHPGRAVDAVKSSRAMVDVILRDELIAAPKSSLNAPISGHRRLAVSSASLIEIKEIKNALGGTVNDVVLTVAAGGLRALLLARGEELPAVGLRAMVPVNIRVASEHLALGNKITSLFVHLPVAEPDPLRRFELQTQEAESLKSGTQAVGTRAMMDFTAHAPPVLHSFLARSMYATRLFNLTITNVPGPQADLYAFGSRMTDIWPIVPLAAEHAVGLAVLSYDGKVFFCLNADRDAMPDLDVLAEGIQESFAELSETARAGDLAAKQR